MADKQLKKKPRQSNFELLRIVSMFMIVLYHVIYHGVFESSNINDQVYLHPFINHLPIYQIMMFGGKVGVALFVLITCYFMNGRNPKITSLLKLWFPVFFWSAGIMMLAKYGFIPGQQVVDEGMYHALTPILSRQYWFINDYFFLILFIPMLNQVTGVVRRNTTIILAIFVVILPTFFNIQLLGVDLWLFILLFFIAGYIKEFKERGVLRKYLKQIDWMALILLLIYICSVLFNDYAGQHTKNINTVKSAVNLSDQTSILVVLFAALVFCMFAEWNLGVYKWINSAATLMFGVYLIHDNNFLRDFIWQNLTNVGKVIKMPYWNGSLYVLMTAIMVFIICGCLELVRRIIFSGLENLLIIKIQAAGKNLQQRFAK